MKKKLLYLILISFINILAVLPTSLRRGFFFCLSRILYFCGRKTNKIIKANLDFVFENQLSNERIKEIQKYTYFNMLQWVRSVIENSSVTADEIKQNVSIQNREIIDNLLKENKKVIIISAHYGNLEMLGAYLNRFVSPMVQVARKSNFDLLDNYLTKSRERSGAKIVYKEGALRHLIKAIMKNKVVSLIIDQNITPKDSVEVELLGKKVNQTISATILARKFGAYIVPVAIFNEDNFRYNIKVYDAIAPIKTDDVDSDNKKLTQLQADALSKIIHEDPKQWFWAHKRFKGHNKEIYE